jgi:hypothetical protein
MGVGVGSNVKLPTGWCSMSTVGYLVEFVLLNIVLEMIFESLSRMLVSTLIEPLPLRIGEAMGVTESIS